MNTQERRQQLDRELRELNARYPGLPRPGPPRVSVALVIKGLTFVLVLSGLVFASGPGRLVLATIRSRLFAE